MKTITIKLYEFGELSDEVRKSIVEQKCFDVMDDVMSCNASEYEASLKAFKDATDFDARGWEVGYHNHHFRRDNPDGVVMGTYDYPVEPEDIKGRLLWRWCYRFVRDNRRGEWQYIGWSKKERVLRFDRGSAERRSRIIMEPITGGWCPWTGVVTDCALVEPIVDFYLNYHRGKYSESYSLEDLIDDCLEKFFDEWESEYNAYGDNKDGIVEEELEQRYDGDYFFANGKKFVGDLDELKAA